MENNIENLRKENINTFKDVLTEGLKQIEQRHQKCLDLIISMGDDFDAMVIKELQSNIHFTRLQAKGLCDIAEVHFVKYTDIYK